MNNNKTRGISGLSILLCVLVLAGVYWFMSQSGVQQTAYTYQDFQKDLKKEKVESQIRSTHPAIFDMLPLTLEEIFIYEMGGLGYEVKDILF